MTTKEFQRRAAGKCNVDDRRAEKIELVSPHLLKPNPANARTHSAKQITQVAASIRNLGFNSPVLLDANDMIVAGHARVEAARELGLTTVPVIRLGHMSPAEVRTYVLADNRLAELSGWDAEILAAELKELTALDLEFDIGLTGFSVPEIDQLIETAGTSAIAASELDQVPDVPMRAVTLLGDIWVIGEHRLICGDSTDAATFEALMAGARAQLVFIDPPYNVPVVGHVSGLGRTQHREFAMASGEMSTEQFTEFLTRTFELHAANSIDGSLQFVCMDWRHAGELLAAGGKAYDALLNLCVWVKSNGGMGSLYRSQHELVFVFKKGTGSHINNVQLGKFGRYRTNVWQYAGANSFGPTRDEDLAAHPTVKPVQMVADAILDSTRPGDIVLDGFAGSGSTLIAAHKVRRRGFGIELDSLYCDVILQRLTAVTGQEAIHEPSGLTFGQLSAERLSTSSEEAGDE